eukprot:m.255872 g.255872  ORF g.255872 m.255872 type:complete len:449 (-) comp19733_c0_seq1:103-1449(-)
MLGDLLAAGLARLPMPSAIFGEAHELADSLTELRAYAGRVLNNRVVLYSLGAYATYQTCRFLFEPVKHLRRIPDVGYITEENQAKMERANEVRRRRLTGDLPPVYPNGWYCVMMAHDLPKKGVKQAHILGLDLAVFRTEEGKVGVIDAYCPHLGANLAAGGTVEKDTLVCPFHGWEFDCDGKCVRIPYAKDPEHVPSEARVAKYTSMEINDQILIWFDAEGREPWWTPPVIDEIQTGTWSFRGKTQHFINAHIQEVPENAADVAHLNYLHGPLILTGIDLRSIHSRFFQFMKHVWEPSWAPCTEPGKEHLSILTLVHRISIFGRHVPILDLYVTATQVGPALVYLKWKSLFGCGVFVQSLTPQEPMLQELTHCIYTEWRVPSIIAKSYMLGEAMQVERDLMVWNNKKYVGKPILISEDSLIGQHRRWYKQFYTENSPRYPAHVDGAEW